MEARLDAAAAATVGEVLTPLVEGAVLVTWRDGHPEGWRAAAPRPDTLPHFPTVLHRGGFPDGA